MSTVGITVRILGRDDASVFSQMASGVFDNEIDVRWIAEFLADLRSYLAVAFDLSRPKPLRRRAADQRRVQQWWW